MAYYAENPFTNCHPTFVTIDDETGRIFQAETAGNPYRFNMEDFLNEKYKNASDKYGSETCSVAEPSLCGGFKTSLKVSFDDWLTELDQGNTWSEFPEQRGEFQKAYEALQAEEKKKQRKAPPATQNQKVAYTSPWQSVINWARGAASNSSPTTSVIPSPSPSPSPTLPPLNLPPGGWPGLGPTKPSNPDFGGGGSSLPPTDTGEKEEEEGDTLTPSNPEDGSWGNSGGGSIGNTGGGSIGRLRAESEGEGFTTGMKIALGLCIFGVGFGMFSALTMD
tara:strand:+ start:1069 stop:1902 length:834 start_codon:yes stop_codon:yes gene_type:complete